MKIIAVLGLASIWVMSHVSFNLSTSKSSQNSYTSDSNKLLLAPQQEELKQSIARGKLLYNEFCVACHLGTGEGVKGTFPPLAKADYLIKYPDKAISAVKFGLKEKIVVNGVTYTMAMPNPGLDNDEIADVMNFVYHSWGNKSPIGTITPKKVESIKP